MNNDVLINGARELGIQLGEREIELFRVYTELLIEWNKKFNLTRITDPEEIAVKHYLDSLTCLTAVKFHKGDVIADVGTGAGFPAVPLAIVRPDIKVVLIEATKKKITFLEQVLDIFSTRHPTPSTQHPDLVHCRAEEAGRMPKHRERYNIVTARAVAEMRVLVEYCLPLVKAGGVFIAMKGPDIDEELDAARAVIGTLGGSHPQVTHLTLPGTDIRRSLVVIKKIKPTPAQFPRHGSKIGVK